MRLLASIPRLPPRSALFLSFLTLLSACARHADESPLRDASFFSGPTSKDTNLSILPLPHDSMASRLRLENRGFATATYLRVIDELDQLGRLEHDDRISGLAGRLHEALYAPGKLPGVAIDRSLYADAATGEGEAMVRPLLGETEAKLHLALARFQALLDRSRHDFPWPGSVPDFGAALVVADRYVAWLEAEIPSLGLDETLLPALHAALTSEYARFRPILARATAGFADARHFADALGTLERLLRELNVQLPPDEQPLLAKADGLVTQLDNLRSSQDVLTMLIYVWRAIPPGKREAVREVSPEFYDYLANKSESELDCLSATVCLNPILIISKTVVLGKISSLGVENLHAQIDTAARDYLLRLMLEQTTVQLPRVPDAVKAEVNKAAVPYIALLKRIQSDFGGFARERLHAWAATHFSAPVRGAEPETLAIRLVSRDQLELSIPAGGELRSGAETLGLSLALSPGFLPGEPERRKAALVEPLLKLLAIGGFRQLGGALFPSLNFALDGKPGDLFDIHRLLGGTTSFAVPDSFRLRGWQLDRAGTHASASVASQAELLRGIARVLRLTRDWERNEFDEALGGLDASQLLPEVPAGVLSYPLFPKPIVFALVVGNGGALLQNVIRRLSPAFLLLRQGEIFWGDRYEEITGANVSTVAGMVPILDGKRAGFVRTGDVARFVLALDEFLAASEGVENTKAPPLLQKNDEGVTVLEQLLDARKKLRLFQMALTNYLVYVSQRRDGTQTSLHSLPALLDPSTEPLLLEDQALAIRALLASARSLEIPVFRWAAVDTYYGMNRAFFDRDAAFYATTLGPEGRATGRAGLHEISLTLLAGGELAPFLPPEARSQWARISRPWLRALGDF